MANKTNKKAANKPEFTEFNIKMKSFDYSGRIYKDSEGNGKGLYRHYLSLCINGLITINNCHLVETSDKVFIAFPNYKSGDNYKSHIFTDEALKEELDELATKLYDEIPA